jgi:hypothetical protein
MTAAKVTDNRGIYFFAPHQELSLNGGSHTRQCHIANEFYLTSPAIVDSAHQPTTIDACSIAADQRRQEEYFMDVFHQQQHLQQVQLHFEQQQQQDGPQHMQMELNYRAPRHQPQQRKNVSFNPSVDILEVKHLNDFDMEEKEQIWLSKEDYARIKAEIYFHLRRGVPSASQTQISDNNLIDTRNFTFRGLETKPLQEQRRHNQREARNAVLNEQLFQRTEKSHLPEVIAMLYNVLSFPCQQHAFEVGVEDAKAVYSSSSHDDIMADADDDDATESRATPQILFECMPMDFEIAYAGDSILDRLASEEASSRNGCALATVESVEDWLVERFQMGKLLARHLLRIRQRNTNLSERLSATDRI